LYFEAKEGGSGGSGGGCCGLVGKRGGKGGGTCEICCSGESLELFSVCAFVCEAGGTGGGGVVKELLLNWLLLLLILSLSLSALFILVFPLVAFSLTNS